MKDRLERLDAKQRERPALGIPIATLKKFSEDKTTALASMIAFWAFFSIFPLLLALVTVLGYVLPDADKKRVLDQIAGYLPLLDVATVGGLQGSVLALVFGLLSALWSGSAVVRITQDAFSSVWEIAVVERPKLKEQVLRSLAVMGTVGVGLIASTLLIGFVSGDNPQIQLGPLGRILGFALVIALDVALFVAIFRMLTAREVTTRDVLPGAIFAGVAFWILQTLASLLITRYLSGAQATYGTFATVITILWWFYLQAQLTLLGAQVNVVLKREFHPRALVGGPSTEADHRVLQAYAEKQRMVSGQEIESEVESDAEDEQSGDSAEADAEDVPAR